MNIASFVTKTEFKEGIEKLAQHFDAKIDSKIDALAEAMAQGFSRIEDTKADRSDIVRVIELLETKADKADSVEIREDVRTIRTDITRIESEIRQGFEDSKNEMATFTSDIHDELSWKINTLADFVGFTWPRRSR